MGWEDRDWAKWTDEERARFVGGSVSTTTTVTCPEADPQRRVRVGALAIAVSLIASFGIANFHVLRPPAPPAAPVEPAPAAPIVYGTGLAHAPGGNQEMTCTAMESDTQGLQSCTTWQYLQPGQRAVQAASLPPGGPFCSAVVADQASGGWKCTRGQLPAAGG